MAAYLGIDVGGTASRWAVVDDGGTLLARGDAPGATGHVFNGAERERLQATLGTIAAQVHAFAPAAARAGITGYGDAVQAAVSAIVGEAFGILPSRVGLSDDIDLAYRAIFAPGVGHLVSAGTGSIGLHIAANGDPIRVGGRGLLIDDGGSGTWIALQALDQVYRRVDETGGPADAAVLATELFAQIGGDRWSDVRAYVYGGDRGRIGALAQAVARAATKGDARAAAILARAAGEIARLGRALVKRAGALPIAFVGGVITLHPLIKPMIEKEMAGLAVSFPQVDVAAYAAAAARQLA